MNRQQWLEATTVLEFACTCLVGLVWVAFSPVAAAKTGIVAFGLVGIWAALALLGGMAQRGARVGLGGVDLDHVLQAATGAGVSGSSAARPARRNGSPVPANGRTGRAHA
ncbi:hypothetical protein ISE09_32020 [Pseudomonas aeruginosa]|nr:hypothetical protein [Pseudomonas aeruginosa]MBX5866610.1 hypothetical protein [Pseudomonas aeruginosa]MBX5903582.1 hypothetical protein [Pseudomonas aeruginosa]